jgi:hypothetical protein
MEAIESESVDMGKGTADEEPLNVVVVVLATRGAA